MNSNIFCDNIVDLWFKDTNTPGFWFELKKKMSVVQLGLWICILYHCSAVFSVEFGN